jgi:hypothetical protein
LGIALGALTAVSIAGLGMFFIGRPQPRQRGVSPTAVVPVPVSEPKPEPIPEPVPEPKPEPAPEPAPEPKTEPAPEPAPGTAPVAKHAPAVGRSAAAATRPAVASAPPQGTAPSKHAKAEATPAKAEARPASEPTPIQPPALQPPQPAPSTEDAIAAIKKAEAAFGESRLATARLAATQAMAASKDAPIPVKVRALVIMGKVQLASEQFAEAERSFGRALALDPDNALARRGIERALQSAAKAKQ